jgi:hypothetical protein
MKIVNNLQYEPIKFSQVHPGDCFVNPSDYNILLLKVKSTTNGLNAVSLDNGATYCIYHDCIVCAVSASIVVERFN